MKIKTIYDIKPLWLRRVCVIFLGVPCLIFIMFGTACCECCSGVRQFIKIWKNEV